MVKLLLGKKGSGKTAKMVDLANDAIENIKGSAIFISKNERLMYDLKYRIRIVRMEDFPHITNCDEYIGFLYGVLSSDYDLEEIYIDSILKHTDFTLDDLPEFITRLKGLSEIFSVNFTVSISAELEELNDVDLSGVDILNK